MTGEYRLVGRARGTWDVIDAGQLELSHPLSAEALALVEDLLDREEWTQVDLEQIQDGLNGRGWYLVERFEYADER